jgi:hypothetical protein
MSRLTEALKRKFKTPQEAIKALGLDVKLLEAENIVGDSKLKRRIARDASPVENMDGDELVERVMAYLRDRLDADDLQEVAALLDALDECEGRGAGDDDYPPVNSTAQDRRIALDARIDARIRDTERARESFTIRFPDAARIGFAL